MGDIRLVVQGDDLGMCRAVNEGIELAATDGILTQSSVMAPTPWFGEGAAMAKRIGLPVGLHVTFTCEWEYLRWGPLTGGSTLRAADGTQHRSVAAAKESIDPADAITEALAQADRAKAAGLELTYVDPHMGVSIVDGYEAVCAREGLRFIYADEGVSPHHDWASIIILSIGPMQDRSAWFADQLEQIGPGTHFVMAHPGVPGPELQALTDRDAPDSVWAEAFRKRDLEALCAREVRAVVDRRGIDLVAVKDL
jgi:predicted glycoside hydrolase/deacetylase ChbG (UPF0249 family)